MEKIFDQVRAEREKQTVKWGEQNHPSLKLGYDTGIKTAQILNLPSEGLIKSLVDQEAKTKESNWSTIALEEFTEVVIADNDYERRAELIQLIAVCVQWVECLDRNDRCSMPKIEVFTDNTPMPFGKYKGVLLANVPAEYLLWLLGENMSDGLLKNYIIEHKEQLAKEVIR